MYRPFGSDNKSPDKALARRFMYVLGVLNLKDSSSYYFCGFRLWLGMQR